MSNTLIDNKKLGETIQFQRRARKIKAVEVATTLGISESAYTRYERGEAEFTITLVQKIAEILKINPFALLAATTASYMVNGDNSPNSQVTLNDSQWSNADPDHSKNADGANGKNDTTERQGIGIEKMIEATITKVQQITVYVQLNPFYCF